VPPLEDIARTALEQVAAGAAPTGVLALLGLLWGSSRFYGALDDAFARIFHAAPRRNTIQRTVRGLVLTALIVVAPIAALVAGAAMSWLVDLAPAGVRVDALARLAWSILSPLGSFILFVGLAAGVYRYVPTARVSARDLSWPAVGAGLVLAAFTQVFAYVAPRLVGTAALYGTFVAGFALLAWLSVGFNVLLLGGAWTRVRARAGAQHDPATAPVEPAGREGRDEPV
jgi:YihY family inner membrane protein